MGPLWSPDGGSFVFTAFLHDPSTLGTWRGNPLHFAELFVHDAESRTTRRLTDNAVHDLVGSWSPDGNSVRTLQHGEPGAAELYYRIPFGADCIRVNEAAGAPQGELCGPGSGETWSPDSTRVAYYVDEAWVTWQVAVRNADGTSRRQLTPVGCTDCVEGVQHEGPTILGWNPSGSLLAFSDTDNLQEDGTFDSRSATTADYVLDLESGEVRKLFEFTRETYASAPLIYLGWSPNGDGLLYVRRSEDGSSYRDLVLLDDVTGDITTLRDIPLFRPRLYPPIRPRVLLSPDQNQLLLIYDGHWHRGILPRLDGSMWLTSVQPGGSTPLIDFGPVISVAKGDAAGDWRSIRNTWSCETEWSFSGILSICG